MRPLPLHTILSLVVVSYWLAIGSTQAAGTPDQGPGSNQADTGAFNFDGFDFGYGGISATSPNLLDNVAVSTIFNRYGMKSHVTRKYEGHLTVCKKVSRYSKNFIPDQNTD